MQKNILIVTGIYPPDVGGPATHLGIVVPEFVRKGNRVTVVTFADDVAKRPGAVQVVRIPRKQFVLLRALRYIGVVVRLARTHEVLYVHDLNLGLIAAWIATIFSKSTFVIRLGGDLLWERAFQKRHTDLSYESFQGNEPFPYNIWRWWTCRLLRNAHTIIVQGEFLKRIVVSWGIADTRVHVVYNAVREQVEEASESTVVKEIAAVQQTGRKAILVSGRFVRGKHFDIAIRAMRHIKNAHLFVIGDGPEIELYKAILSEPALQKAVTFRKSLSGPEMRAVLRAVDCYVLPSETDTFSFMVLESLLADTPVVLYRTGALKELFAQYEGDGVSFLDALEPQQLSELLQDQRVYSAPTEDTKTSLKDRFSVEKHFEDVHDIVLGINKRNLHT